ncbi:fumarase, class II [Rhodoblastus acidophilus]|uniref:Fumarate hydratase class II n=1 Tax=Rhodoblastus acidophilus TaxID=1074 RepID=A0A212QMK5_RHOAC|nr:class II fumarate hydratase [Rhodoblastus acidophilus]PPQ38876.1 class II fumarate hydratase [Rhodoblastus acidophilus]RAI18028.1 class II fumarate hydratase [Rhodoblastus acidophilus]SNB60630.1 fumarase, class II [Rhodoblastus acidophilus]
MAEFRIEQDALGQIAVPAEQLWGAQTQRALEHFAIGREKFPPEMTEAYALLKKACARANAALGRLDEARARLIESACDEILSGAHAAQFPLPVWISGSGTQFNMNVNEVISNLCCRASGTPLGGKAPVHPNDHANLSQSSNDTFPAATHIAAVLGVTRRLTPALETLRDALAARARDWADIVKIGRTHLQDATPLTLGQEWSGFAALLDDNLERIGDALKGTFRLTTGGTAVGTGVNAPPGFAEAATMEIVALTSHPFVVAPNKFAAQGSHDALVALSGALRVLAGSLKKIADDIRFLACGPRAGIAELILPANEPGSSIMPGKVNPTQVEALTMIALQVSANDVAIGMGGAGGRLQMNAYKPLIAHNLLQSIGLLADGCACFRRHLVEGVRPNAARIAENVERSLALATALVPILGYDKASTLAHHAAANDLSLREAALALDFVSAEDFDRLVDPRKMLGPDRRD